MRTIFRVMFLLAVFALGGKARQLPAQSTMQAEPLNCEKCEETFAGNYFHRMTGVSCIIPEDVCFDCTKDGGCHSASAMGQCDINSDPTNGHHWCGTEEALVELKRLRRDGEFGGESAFLKVANRFPKSIRRTAEGYFVVTNCKGAIVAAYKPGKELFTRPASAKKA